MRWAGKYEMALSGLVHYMYTAQVCARTLAVLAVICYPQSLQTNAKIVLH